RAALLIMATRAAARVGRKSAVVRGREALSGGDLRGSGATECLRSSGVFPDARRRALFRGCRFREPSPWVCRVDTDGVLCLYGDAAVGELGGSLLRVLRQVGRPDHVAGGDPPDL